MFDLCFVLYNSEKWLNDCIKSFVNVSYDKKKLSLYFADNQSTDGTLQTLEKLKAEYGHLFNTFEILPQKENGGFGKGSNAAARQGKGDYVFFCNVDTEIHPDAFSRLEEAIQNAPKEFAAFELRQFPYEHPKYYDPITMEVSWASGACFVLRRDVFEQTGGFDESIFMYAEDVDLSWHVRALGYKIMYVPSAILNHYAYKCAGEEKPTQVVGGISGNLVLRYKYGNKHQVNEWERLYQLVKPRIENDAELRKKLMQQLRVIKNYHKQYRKFYSEKVENSNFKPNFMEFDYEFARNGAFYESHLPTQTPCITVIVRTYQRPELLSLTLKSLCHQTYKNFKVLVVEDGKTPVSEKAVERFKGQLDLEYYPLRAQMGRCKAGNVGLQQSKTDYVCFLDDDDYFFAEHMEVMACLIEENPDCGVYLASSVLGKCQAKKSDPTQFRYLQKVNHGKDIQLIDFFKGNPVPIQAVVFKRDLYTQYGGFDETLDALEDWDLWMRYLTHTSFAYAEKATSIFKVPADESIFAERDKFIGSYRKQVFHKMKNYGGYVSAQDVYGIFWKPAEETVESLFVREEGDSDSFATKQRKKDHSERLKASVREVQQSRTWKITAPLRIFPWILRVLVAGLIRLILAVLSFVGNVLYKVFIGLNKIADKLAPKSVNVENATEEELTSFLILSKKSFCWKLLHRK